MNHAIPAEDIEKLKYKYLARHTDNFCESNYIGHFQFGKLYRSATIKSYGRSPDYLMVKILKDPEIYNYRPEYDKLRLMKELLLLRHELLINHPAMIKLYGYSSDGEHLCIAYEFKPFDSLFNLIPKDGFTWLQRIKAAFVLASLLKYLHSGIFSPFKPFAVNNLDAAHILLDEDYNPKLCDVGSMSGGIFAERGVYPGDSYNVGCYGYTDMDSNSEGDCSIKNDVFAFGVILLSLISKRVYTEEDRVAGEPYVYQWALKEAELAVKNIALFSLVHNSIADAAEQCGFYPDDGYKITKVALDCVNGVESQRPTMKQVYRVLKKLEVVQQHANFLGPN